MPVAAVAIAGLAIGAATEIGTPAAIVAAIGATVGAVGSVTGSKPLQIRRPSAIDLNLTHRRALRSGRIPST